MLIDAKCAVQDGDEIRVEPGHHYDYRLQFGEDLSIYLDREDAYRVLSTLESALTRDRERDLEELSEVENYAAKGGVIADWVGECGRCEGEKRVRSILRGPEGEPEGVTWESCPVCGGDDPRDNNFEETHPPEPLRKP